LLLARWPVKFRNLGLYRHQTLAFKAFLVSACSSILSNVANIPTKEHLVTIFGLVVTADNVLLKHEARRRAEISALRKEARIDFARRGIIPTETAFREWQAEREKAEESSAENAP